VGHKYNGDSSMEIREVRGEACPLFTGSVAFAGKSSCLEILAYHRCGDIENSNDWVLRSDFST
jgi:predicted nucleic acid-binding Zn finger protein